MKKLHAHPSPLATAQFIVAIDRRSETISATLLCPGENESRDPTCRLSETVCQLLVIVAWMDQLSRSSADIHLVIF